MRRRVHRETPAQRMTKTRPQAGEVRIIADKKKPMEERFAATLKLPTSAQFVGDPDPPTAQITDVRPRFIARVR